ncbi:MAG: peptidase M23, partial [Clostridia bacterium]|nr:peptidase M23 [Clostridia bacterium]
MRALTRYSKMMKMTNIATMLIVMLVLLIFVPAIEKFTKSGNNLFKMYVNGTAVGIIDNPQIVDGLMLEARRKVAGESNELVLLDYDVALNGIEAVIGQTDNTDEIVNNIYNVLLNSVQKTKKRVYTVKINEYTVNLATSEEVFSLLNAAKAKYDQNNMFKLSLVLDPTRELNVLTTHIEKTEESEEEKEPAVMPVSGAAQTIHQVYEEIAKGQQEEFNLGLISLDFGENVEIVQAYVDENQLSSLDAAIEYVTKDQEKSKIYEVTSGDSLSVIAEKNDTT